MARSKAKPVVAKDKMISVRHLRETMMMNRKHMNEHMAAADHTSNKASEKYHLSHAKEHKKALKIDAKLLKKRSGS